MNSYCIAALLSAASAFAQETPKPPDRPATSEPQESRRTLTEASPSTDELARACGAQTEEWPASRSRLDGEPGEAGALVYQSRAKTVLGDREAAEKLAAKSFSLYPSEEAAREWADALERLGRHEEAITHMAEAFAIPDSRATDSDRSGDRQ